jgi:hypothetical protein
MKSVEGSVRSSVAEKDPPDNRKRASSSSSMASSYAPLKRICFGIEFLARLVMVNIPSYLLAKSSELDRVCSLIFTYLCLQVVGCCWAFLVNACFALACRAPQYLFLVDINSFSLTTQLLAAFYVSYASIRVVISFGIALFSIALESIKDFPEAATLIANGKQTTLSYVPMVFVPAMALELAMIAADVMCDDLNAKNSGSTLYGNAKSMTCNRFGLKFLTDAYPDLKRLLFFAMVTMVLQLWQVFLNQFPHWDAVFRTLRFPVRVCFQLSVLFLVTGTISVLFIFPFFEEKTELIQFLQSDIPVNMLLFGWTLWLYLFVPNIIRLYGEIWAERVTPFALQSLVAYIRISECIILCCIFIGVFFSRGFLAAQRDLTFLSIVLPALYCLLYILFAAVLRTGDWIYRVALPTMVALSFLICHVAIYSGMF